MQNISVLGIAQGPPHCHYSQRTIRSLTAPGLWFVVVKFHEAVITLKVTKRSFNTVRSSFKKWRH